MVGSRNSLRNLLEVPRLNPRLLAKVLGELLERVDALDDDGGHVRYLTNLAVSERVGAGDLHIATRRGELHAVDLHADVTARLGGFGESRLERIAVRREARGHGITRHEIGAGEHRDTCVIGRELGALGKRESDAGYLFVGSRPAFPRDAGFGSAQDVVTGFGVRASGALFGIERERGRRSNQSARERHRERDGERDENSAQTDAALLQTVLHDSHFSSRRPTAPALTSSVCNRLRQRARCVRCPNRFDNELVGHSPMSPRVDRLSLAQYRNRSF